MDDRYLNYKKEIKKINQRIKEYLWKKRYLYEARNFKSKNFRPKLLAR